MNLIPRMCRVIVAVTLMAGSPGSVYAASIVAQSLNKGGAPAQLASGQKMDPAAQARVRAGFLNLPLSFEKNQGQTDASVKFFARAGGYNLYLTGTEAVMVLNPAKAAKTDKSAVVRMKLKGANANPAVRGQDILPGRTSYFFGGDRSKWQTGVESYAKVRYSSVYPGIDMVYYGKQGHVEHDFIVAPGANPGRILVGFEGAKALRLDPKGNLILSVEGGEVTYKAPTLYQMRGSERAPVRGRFVLAGKNQVRFEVGDYIRSKALVIDPEVTYSTFLGGSVDDAITGIAVDTLNQAYVTGWARSASTLAGFAAPTKTFPAVIGANRGGADVFVAKLSADGTSLVWLAWLGGTLDEQANGIVLEKIAGGTPKVFITGTTASAGAGTSFPMSGALQTCEVNTGSLAFVAGLEQLLTPNTPTLVYSTCWGGVSGTLGNAGNAITVDSIGAAYVTGTTFASNFPISAGVPAPYNAMGGASQAGFVLKLAPLGASVGYSMLLGTSDRITNSNAIAVDANFRAWVAGMTTATTLPMVGGHFASSNVGTSDAFVAEVSATGTGLLYATYINGNSDQTATAIALNNAGATPYHVFVAGWTVSATDFPSTAYYNLPTAVRPAVYQKDLAGSYDPFIIRLNPNEPNPVPGADNPLEIQYATHLGATGEDRAFALALDSRDDAYISGYTLSSDWTLAVDPVTPCAGCPVNTPGAGLNITGATTSNTSGAQDAFVAAIGPTGQYQPFFTYLGATPGTPGRQTASAIAIGADHSIYVGGYTPSAIFPLTWGSLMDGVVMGINGNGTAGAIDGFVTKIAPVVSFGAPIIGVPPPPPAVSGVCTISGISPNSGFTLGGTTVTITGTNFSGFGGTGSVAFGGVAASTYTANAAKTVITAVTPRHPLVGTPVPGAVPVTVATSSGTCSTSYNYVAAPSGSAALCGDDYFFPSPATGHTGQFAYCMDGAGTVKIRVYNVIGDIVAKIEESKPSGAQLSTLNTGRLAPGVYLYIVEKVYGGGNTSKAAVKKFLVKH